MVGVASNGVGEPAEPGEEPGEQERGEDYPDDDEAEGFVDGQ